MKKVRLVLGSGGARGIAHIGVIEELEKAGFQVEQVVGCSMGAVVGGIYCAGHLQLYKEWLVKLTRLDVFRLLDFTFSVQGFVKGERVFKAIEEFIGDHSIENFRIPFTAVATDITSRKEVHFDSGSLFRALRASIAIPTVFTPIIDSGMQLVDGGLLNPLPLDLVRKEPDDLVVAVNVNSTLPVKDKTVVIKNTEKVAHLKMLSALRAKFRSEEKLPVSNIEKLGFFDLVNKSFDLTQDRLTELMIRIHNPDIVVNVCRDACGVFEFYRAQELIEQGREAFHDAYTHYRSSAKDAAAGEKA